MYKPFDQGDGETLIPMAAIRLGMTEDDFPSPKELHNKHFPDERYGVSLRKRVSSGHSSNPENFIGGIPKDTPYLTLSLARGSWDHPTWDRVQEAYEAEGYSTHLRKSSGTSRTMSGTSKHTPTTLYAWQE